MTSAPTTTEIEELAARIAFACRIPEDGARYAEADYINDTLGHWVGLGDMRADLEATGYAIGPDYVCATATGEIVAMGADLPNGFRSLVIISAPQ